VARAQLLEEALVLYVAAVRLLDPVRLRAWSDMGLTMPALKLLVCLRDEPGAPSGVLATHLGVSPSTVTGLVDRLVRQGLVRRGEDREDRRLVRNMLTPEGIRTVGELERQSRDLMQSILTRLDDRQLAQLVTALQDLNDAATNAIAVTT
jgi:DNA-binding MarR family transcriptional regulator